MSDNTPPAVPAAPAPEAPAAPAAPAPEAPAAWHGAADPEVQAYIQNKGWQNPQDVIKSYRGAEKLIGKNPDLLLEMPRADDAAGQRALMAKLGMPETADKYELTIDKSLPNDEAYMGWAKEAFHKAGLTAAQAKALTAEHNAYVKQTLGTNAQDYERNVAADKQSLLKEWGGGHERMMNVAKMSAQRLGFSQEMIDSMETAVGYGATMKFFADLGMKMSEDGFVGSDTKTGGFGDVLTPAEAKVQWEAMKMDPNQAKALMDSSHPGHKGAKEKQSKLFSIMYPG